MTITAKIVADSTTCDGIRLTTMQLRYPRFIHAEFMTHRVFSRNASSSRAIPVERMIQDVLDDPAMPVHWGKNQPGMQAREEHDAPIDNPFALDFTVLEPKPPLSSKEAWLWARDDAIDWARRFAKAGYHKQIVNRLLEPWLHINVVVTATEWDNFFELRLHEDAQPEIHELARQMKLAMDQSYPAVLMPGAWHLPYVTRKDWTQTYEITGLGGSRKDIDARYDLLRKISVARCARVSYLTHDGGKPSI